MEMLNKKNGITSIEFVFGIITILAVLLMTGVFAKNFIVDTMQNMGKQNTFYAFFEDVDGISEGTDVKIAGLNVGRVERIALENDYQVKLTIKIDKKYVIPTDTMIAVSTSGILGGKYLKLTPGSEDTLLKSGSEIKFTESSIGMEGLLSIVKNLFKK